MYILGIYREKGGKEGYEKERKMRRNIRVWDSVRHAQGQGLARRITSSSLFPFIVFPPFFSPRTQVTKLQRDRASERQRDKVMPRFRLSSCPSVRLSICPSARLTVCPFIRLSVLLDCFWAFSVVLAGGWYWWGLVVVLWVFGGSLVDRFGGLLVGVWWGSCGEPNTHEKTSTWKIKKILIV